MKYKYQIILLGSLGELSEKIKILFFKKVEELKLPSNSFMVIYDKNIDQYSRKNLTKQLSDLLNEISSSKH